MTKAEALSIERAPLMAYTLRGVGIDVGCGNDKFEGSNVIGIDKYNAKADRVYDFEKMMPDGQCDFVIMSHYLRYTHDIIKNLIKGIKFLKLGGWLLILETQGPDPKAPYYYNFLELEGWLMLFEDHIHIDFRGEALPGHSYYYVCRRVADADKVSK